MQEPKAAEAPVATAPPADQINSLIALHNQGQFQELLTQGQALAEQYPRAVIVHNLIGTANAGLGRPTDAIASYTRALQINPGFAEAHNNIGLALRGLGKLDEAIASYSKALQIKPDFAKAHYNLGKALMDLGKLDEAIASYSKALQIKPDFAKAHYNLGLALRGLGKLDEAIASYSKALQIRPDFAEAHNDLGCVLDNLGMHEEAIVSYTRALQIKPDFAEAHNNIGLALKDLGKRDEAIASYSKALQIKPDFAKAHNNLGKALRDLGKLDEAIASYSKALQIEPDFAKAHYNLGKALMDLGKLDEAIASYSKAVEIEPDYVKAHNILGCALNDLRRHEEAIVSFTRALQIEPDYADVHNNLGVALKSICRFDEAIASYTRAVKLKPDHVLANRNLCALLDRLNRAAEFANALNEARQAGLEDNNEILFLSAQLSSRNKNAKETLAFLDRISPELPLMNQRRYFKLIGKTYDRLGLFDKAFAEFQTQNEIAKKTKIWNPAADLDNTVQLTESWSSGEKFDWSATSPEAEDVSIAFLVGFPRSGTTLLDTILRGHPGVTVVEEEPMVRRMRRQFGRNASIEELNTLTSSDLKRLRHAYLDELKIHVNSSDMDGLVIDKFPLNIRYAGLIHRVFPKAKFILALRHPCDCVLSCFAQNFELNDAMANFLTLDQSAKFYAAVMGLWRAYRNALNLDVGVVKYEDLIQDLRRTCVPLIEFLGLEWDDNLLNYQQTAKSRGWINTPSYDQVTQPLYKQASGRWENYRKQMQPVLPILEPWIKEFGYGD